MTREEKEKLFDHEIATNYKSFKAEYLDHWDEVDHLHIEALKTQDGDKENETITVETYRYFTHVERRGKRYPKRPVDDNCVIFIADRRDNGLPGRGSSGGIQRSFDDGNGLDSAS